MLAATEDGTWVPYVYNNPATENIFPERLGAVQLKHAWVVKQEEPLFGSGWYISADEYTKLFVDEAIERYHLTGLEATLEHYSGDDSVFREWYASIADDCGRIVAHYNPAMIGKSLVRLARNGYVRDHRRKWRGIL